MEDQLNPEDKARGEDIANEPANPELPAPRFGYADHDENVEGKEKVRQRRAYHEVRQRGAYHEAAHTVIGVVEGHTLRYVSIETEGTDYRDICVSSVACVDLPGVGLVPAPRHALGHAIAILAGPIAMWKQAGKAYPLSSGQAVLHECEEIEELGDLGLPDDQEEDDVTQVREYCEAAARWGQTVRAFMPPGRSQPVGAQ